MLSELINEVASLWPEYSKSKKTNKDSRVHQIIVRDIPNILSTWLGDSEKYLCEGSEGQGNLLKAPWIAAFNRSITESAQKGYYVVFLFSEDMKSLTLEIGFGATQFKNRFGTGSNFFNQIERAVINMRANSQHLLQSNLKKTVSRTNIQNVKLDLSGNFLLRAYEKCSIYSLTYKITEINDITIKNDFIEYMSLYDAMADSLLLADVDDYVLEQVVAPEKNFEKTPIEFSPRIRKVKNLTKNKSTSSSNNRKSKRSEKIGRIGEEWVYQYEISKLIAAGKPELAEQVIWHRNYPQDRTPGWDITSFNLNGEKKFIEVKSSEGNVINDFILTAQEWEKANGIIAEDYFVYLVTSVITDPSLEILKNPKSYIQSGKLTLAIESYSLSLYLNQ